MSTSLHNPNEPTGPLDREKQTALLEQVNKLFMRHGIKSMTMDDVANNLRISKKTLYQFVTDKNDLVERSMARMNCQHNDAIDAICAQGLNAIDEQYEIAKYVSGVLSQVHPSIHYDLEKYHPRAWEEFNGQKREHIYACMTRNMHNGMKEGLYRDDLNVDIIAKIYLARFDLLFDGELFPAEKYRFADIMWESFRYHVRGIASEKGVKYLEKKTKKERS
jgi:TetR/AcrR family transcriptional regulator, cholesterol catabolism regulator